MHARFAAGALLSLCHMALAAETASFDAASAFGARPSVVSLSLSPDGMNVVWLGPAEGEGSIAYTMSLAKDAQPHEAFRSGRARILGCGWVSNERLVCTVGAITRLSGSGALVGLTRVLAVNADGSNAQVLSRRDNDYTRGVSLGGGTVIDWLPSQDSALLMTRLYLPDDSVGSRAGSSREGLGVDQIDTRTLATHNVEAPRRDSAGFISDGRGTVRITTLGGSTNKGRDTAVLTYLFHPQGSEEWKTLSAYNVLDHSGFRPVAVDPDLNVAYGFKMQDGREALFSVTLDDARREQLIYANPDVDVDELIRIGRRNRVVGVSYATDYRRAVYFAPDVKQLIDALSKALHEPMLRVVDASADESRLLIITGTDTDPGVYYIFDRHTHELRTFLVVRRELEGVQLAAVKPVNYPATDGTAIPAYLTLPPAREAKGLPAIVLPHGGPGARDYWGFDWLAQFFAARGYAVLQPNFRGSSGYGDAWFKQNGFRSWQIAIGDVVAAGHWLVSQGIADPNKLGILGWSYGGYAALQSQVLEPGLFRAVVAIAPVTDLASLREQRREWSDYDLLGDYIGDGPQLREGSPAQHAERFKVPVLMFHGVDDRTVSIEHSRLMQARLQAAGAKSDLVTFEGLDHDLQDSSARAQLLRKSDAFLRQAFGM
jgi:dipeptidyl aminopeptidase/acylaminoacyl peptidase